MTLADAYALALLAGTLGVAIGWCIGRYNRRTDASRAERAARPPGPHPVAVADELALALHTLATSCCLTAAVTAGAEHDTTTCTRKDQTL
ncbi:hypothetical protein [Streptomyces tendae]|uniref:hypothetical protein n=1 Tax=Streptomyces tendae TaxID=1932 RepID=UPI003EBB176C